MALPVLHVVERLGLDVSDGRIDAVEALNARALWHRLEAPLIRDLDPNQLARPGLRRHGRIHAHG